jgi:hypothetical protein
MTKTAHSDIAGAIKWATARLKRLNDDLVLCEPDRYQKPAWIAERDALTLLIDTVRGYEAMMEAVECIEFQDGQRIDQPCSQPPGQQCWHYDHDGRIDLFDTSLAAFRAVAKEGDDGK